MKINSHFLPVAVVAASCFSFGGFANAALIDCPGDFIADGTAKVYYLDGQPAVNNTAASECEFISPSSPNTIANKTTVNANEFFGFKDWLTTVVLQTEPRNGATGNWAISNPDFVDFDYMIVFKDGAGTNLVGFLLNEDVSSGLWSSPFTNPPFTELKADQIKDVSHFSIFKRASDGGGGDDEIPEPGVLFLMGAGLLGLGLARRRKSA